MMKIVPMVLGVVIGALVVTTSGCDQAQPAVATISPAEARPGEILIIAGKGLGDQVVKVGEVEAQVKSRGADSLLVVEVPKNMKPGNYDVVVSNKDTKAASKPVKVRVLDLVTVPAGTALRVRVVQSISSGQNHVGETFLLALDQPLVVEGRTIAGEGSEVLGRVVQVDEGGRVKGSAQIEFTLVQLNRQSHHAIATGNVFAVTGHQKRAPDHESRGRRGPVACWGQKRPGAEAVRPAPGWCTPWQTDRHQFGNHFSFCAQPFS
jgi:hypothetical protein